MSNGYCIGHCGSGVSKIFKAFQCQALVRLMGQLKYSNITGGDALWKMAWWIFTKLICLVRTHTS